MGNELQPVNTDMAVAEEHGATPASERVAYVGNVMMQATSRASTLVLTKEESDALQADFPDEAFKYGAAGKENLIYIEHAYLRDRFNQVLGLGAWTIIRTRPHWAENYEVWDSKSNGKKPAVRVYSDCALLIRGCLVSEGIGDMSYFPDNAAMTYSDAAEGATTQAFRRCAKNFGVGIQAWKKDWCEGWTKRHAKGQQARPPIPQRQDPTIPTSQPVKTEAEIKAENERNENLRAWINNAATLNDLAGVWKSIAAQHKELPADLMNELTKLKDVRKALLQTAPKLSVDSADFLTPTEDAPFEEVDRPFDYNFKPLAYEDLGKFLAAVREITDKAELDRHEAWLNDNAERFAPANVKAVRKRLEEQKGNVK